MRSNDRLGINHAPTPAGAKEPDAGKEGICEKKYPEPESDVGWYSAEARYLTYVVCVLFELQKYYRLHRLR